MGAQISRSTAAGQRADLEDAVRLPRPELAKGQIGPQGRRLAAWRGRRSSPHRPPKRRRISGSAPRGVAAIRWLDPPSSAARQCRIISIPCNRVTVSSQSV